MSAEKPYRVKDGQELAHGGDVLPGGSVVQLLPAIAHEVRHLVEPIGDDGQVKPWGAPSDEAIDAELAAARPHERISILEQAIAAKRGDLERLEQLHASEVKANEAAAKALEKPKVDEPKGSSKPAAAPKAPAPETRQ